MNQDRTKSYSLGGKVIQWWKRKKKEDESYLLPKSFFPTSNMANLGPGFTSWTAGAKSSWAGGTPNGRRDVVVTDLAFGFDGEESCCVGDGEDNEEGPMSGPRRTCQRAS